MAESEDRFEALQRLFRGEQGTYTAAEVAMLGDWSPEAWRRIFPDFIKWGSLRPLPRRKGEPYLFARAEVIRFLLYDGNEPRTCLVLDALQRHTERTPERDDDLREWLTQDASSMVTLPVRSIIDLLAHVAARMYRLTHCAHAWQKVTGPAPERRQGYRCRHCFEDRECCDHNYVEGVSHYRSTTSERIETWRFCAFCLHAPTPPSNTFPNAYLNEWPTKNELLKQLHDDISRSLETTLQVFGYRIPEPLPDEPRA